MKHSLLFVYEDTEIKVFNPVSEMLQDFCHGRAWCALVPRKLINPVMLILIMKKTMMIL